MTSSSQSTSTKESEVLSLVVSYRGQIHTICLAADTPLSKLNTRLTEITGVPTERQKLLYKGKPKDKGQNKGIAGDDEHEQTLTSAGLRNGTRVQLLGTTSEELNKLQSTEATHQRTERILRERAQLPRTALRKTGPSSRPSPLSDPTNTTFKFHSIRPLPHLPSPSSANALLERLSTDRAILQVMRMHRMSVGLLTELAPHEHPDLLGLNVNAGQEIKLRLRTNAYDGFRNYNDVRKVLCHELAHNVHGDHDENFKTLNSQLNREVAEFERASSSSTHHLSGLTPSDMYQPTHNAELETHAHILGGSDSGGGDSVQARRQRALEAAMRRLRKEEEEIEQSCGTHTT